MEGIAPALGARLAQVVLQFQSQHKEMAILVAESDPTRLRLFTPSIYTIERGEVVDKPSPV